MALDFNPSYQTADERVAEKDRIIKILLESNIDEAMMTEREAEFVTNMAMAPTSVSPAQLNWLRRIKEKYL